MRKRRKVQDSMGGGMGQLVDEGAWDLGCIWRGERGRGSG